MPKRSRPRTAKRRRHQFHADKVPPALFRRVVAKSRREGISIRSLILDFLEEWVNRKPTPD